MLTADPTRHALEIGRRVADTGIRREALLRLRRDTTKPLANHWRPAGVSMGGAGLVVMCASLDELVPGQGWDQAGHRLLESGLRAINADDLSLFSGAVGYMAAAWLSSKNGSRYRSLTASLEETLLPSMQAFARRPPGGPDSYDVVNGIAGWAGYLCCRKGDPAIERTAEAAAEALAAVLSPDGLGRIRYMRDSVARVDCGMAHGVAGLVAALSLLETTYGLGGRSLRWGVSWLADQVETQPAGLLWPSTSPSTGEILDEGSWCHGSSGIAHALYLASVATGSSHHRDLAVSAMLTQQPALASPNLCHGMAGQLLLMLSVAHGTGHKALRDAARRLAGRLAAAYQPESLLGYLDVEQPGGEVDNPGLMRGAAGVCLALLAAEQPCMPAWARMLLLL